MGLQGSASTQLLGPEGMASSEEWRGRVRRRRIRRTTRWRIPVRLTRALIVTLIGGMIGGIVPIAASTAVAVSAYANSTTPYADAVNADAPLAYYRLDETTGLTAADSSAQHLNGQYSAGTTLAVSGAILSEPADTAASSSSGQLFSYTGSGLPVGNQSRTYELWMKTTAGGDCCTHRQILQNGDFTLGVVSCTGCLNGLNVDNAGTNVTAGYSLSDNLWHMIDITWDGTTAGVYVDGQITGSVQPGALSTGATAGLTLGSGVPGSYDEVAVYPSSLSASRMNAHWTAGGSRGAACLANTGDPYGRSVGADSPSALFRLKDMAADGTDRVAYDSSGNCANGSFAPGATADTAGGPVGDSSGAVTGMLVQSGQYLPVGNHSRTYELWMKTIAGGDCCTPRKILQNGDFTLGVVSCTGCLNGLNVDSAATNVTAPFSLSDNLWHMIDVTWDGSTAGVYVDGQVTGYVQPGALSTAATAGMTLGVGVPGSYDELAVYPTTLSASRINAHWTAGGSRGPACARPPTSGYSQTVMAARPVLYMPLHDLVTDATDRAVYDYSGRCANGAYSAGVTADPGDGPPANPVGAANVNSSTVVTQSGQNLPSGNSARTYELWLKTTSGGDCCTDRLIVANGDFTVGMLSCNGCLNTIVINGTAHIDPPYSLTDNSWHLIAVTWDGSNATLIIDGIRSGSVAPGPVNTRPAAGLALNASNTSNSQVPGSYQELAVYSAALDTRVIADQFSGGHGGGPMGGPIGPGELYGNANTCYACLAKDIHSITADPIDTATGNFSETYHDISVPGRGVPLDFSRTYNSGAASGNGPLGFGWTFSYNMSLTINATTVVVNQENGAQETFTLSGGAYSAPPRVIATLTKNGDGSYTFVRQHRQTYQFSATGQLISEIDLNGYTTTLARSTGSLVITEPAGRSLSVAYSGALISTVTDVATGREVTFGYDGPGNLIDVTDVNGGNWHFGYDSNHLMTTLRDPRGNTTTNHYDAQGRVDYQLDPLSRKTQLAYTGTPLTGAGGSTTVTDPKMNQTVYNYAYGLRVSETRGYSSPAAATWQYTYDPATVAVSTITDPNGNISTHTYDVGGNEVGSTDPLGRQIQNSYDPTLGTLLSSTDPLSATSTKTIDSHGNVLWTCRPLTATCPAPQSQTTCPVSTALAITCYGYAGQPGDVTSVTDPDGHIWSSSYDAYGDRTQVIDPLGNKTTSTFNADGWLTSTVSPKGNISGCGCAGQYTSTFDYADQRIGGGHINGYGDVGVATDPLGHSTKKTYDADRNLTAVLDAKGNTTASVFDAANQGVQTVRADTTIQQTVYDADGLVSLQIDGLTTATSAVTCVTLAHCTSFQYDSLNHVSSVRDADGRSTQYVYDAVGNLLAKTDPQGRTTANTYDADNELTSRSFSDGSTPGISSIRYDADGRRTDVTDGSGTTRYQFDSLGRLISQQNGAGSVVGYGYDLRGDVTSLTYPNATGTVTKHYDDAGRMDWVQDWQGNKTSFPYDANGNLTGETYPNGIAATYTNNRADQVTAVSDAASNTAPILNLAYGRDTIGQLSSENANAALYDPNNRVASFGSAGYGYDSADELTQLPTKVVQQFDPAGQLMSDTQPISLVGHGHATSNGGSVTVPLNVTTQPNDVVVLGVTSQSNANFKVVPPSGASEVARSPAAGTGQVPAKSQLFIYKSGGGDTSLTVGEGTVPFSLQVVAVVYRGVDPTTPVDDSRNAGTSGTSMDVPALNASVSGDRLVLFQGAQGNSLAGSFSASSMTEIDSSPTQALGVGAMADEGPLASGPSPDGKATFSQSASLAAVMIALKPQITGFMYDPSGKRTSRRDAFGNTTSYAFDQANRMTSYNGTITYGYNGDGLRMSKGSQQFTWDESSGLPQVLNDGKGSYVYGPGGLPVEQVTSPRPPITWAGTGLGKTQTGPLSITFDHSAQSNDVILVGVTTASSNAVDTPSGYQTLKVSPGAHGTKTWLFWRKAAGGETAVSVSETSGQLPFAMTGIAMLERNLDPSTPFDGVSAADSGGGNVTAPSISPTTSGDTLLMFEGVQGNTIQGNWNAGSMNQDTDSHQTLSDSAWAQQQPGAAGPTGSRTASYSQTGALGAILLALRPLPTTFYFHLDQLGSTRVLTDPQGAVAAAYQYDAYGNTLSYSGTVTTPVLYAGQYQDVESGLYYLRARYYDPSTGQFISRDPLTATTRAPYSYVADNPLNGTDPSGLVTKGFCIHTPSIGIVGYIGGEGCVQVASGPSGVQWGFSGSVEVGAGSPSLTFIGAGAQESNGNTISDLGGPFGNLGGSGGQVITPGVEGFIGPNDCGQTIVGGEASIGLGARPVPPIEVHGGVSYTATKTVINIDRKQHPILAGIGSYLIEHVLPGF